MNVIDAHVHVWERPVAGQYRTAGVRIPRNWQRDLLLGYMAECGVSRAIVVAAALGGNDENNEWLTQMVRDDPEHFAGLACVDPRSPTAIAELDKTANRFRLQGISHYLWPPDKGKWLIARKLEAFWQRAQDLGLLVSLNVSHLQAEPVGELARRFEGITFLLCHMGRPDLNQPLSDAQFAKILALADRPGIFVKVSGFYAFSRKGWDYPCHDQMRFVRMLTSAFGSDRLLWGSDFPPCLGQMTYRQSLEIVKTHCPFLSDEQKADILGRTAERVLGRCPGGS